MSYIILTSHFHKNGGLCVIKKVDFTSENRTDDPYGHGTHVASIAAGNGAVSNGEYVSIASKAKLINLRVLNSQEMGTVSGVLSALDWVSTNRTAYSISVVNMSPNVRWERNDKNYEALIHLAFSLQLYRLIVLG